VEWHKVKALSSSSSTTKKIKVTDESRCRLDLGHRPWYANPWFRVTSAGAINEEENVQLEFSLEKAFQARGQLTFKFGLRP
jgi:hypothetical protein